MLLLTSTSDKIQILTSSAATLEVNAAYADNASGVIIPGRKLSTFTTADLHDAVLPPASGVQRNVRTLTTRNDHTSLNNTVEIIHTDGSDSVTIWSGILGPKEQVVLNQTGDWKRYSSNGSDASASTSLASSATVNGPVTLDDTYYYISVTEPTATITLPLASENQGREYIIDHNSGSVDDLEVVPSETDTIQGKTSQLIANNSAMRVISTGSEWRIV